MAAAAAAADPSSSSSSPSSVQAGRHPWTQIARGEREASSSAAPPSSCPPLPAAVVGTLEASDRSPKKPPPEDVSSSDAAVGKKQAWKQPPNGSVESGPGVIGGAASWPALSESTKGPPKSSSSDSLKPLSDDPLSVLPGPASPASQKPNSNPSLSRNHMAPTRQKSMKRSGSNSSSVAAADGGVTPSSPTKLSAMPMMNSDKQAQPEHSPRDQTTKNTVSWDRGSGAGLGSHANDGSDHIRSGGNRRWNSGGGAGYHQNNYSNHRDVERGGYDGYRRNTGGRDSRMQQRAGRAYFRPPAPHVTPQFLNPPQVAPFGNPMFFPDMPSPIFYVATQPPPGGVPFIPHTSVPPAMFMPAIDPHRASLLKQIDYYFSPENLCRDVYLRQNMDEQGWVPISLIAGFNRVRRLTNSIEFILDTLRWSTVVEVQGDKVRKRQDWIHWVLPPNNSQIVSGGNPSPATLNSDDLAAHLQSLGIEGTAYQNSIILSNRSDIFLSRSASGNLSNHLQVTANHNWNENEQAITHADSDRLRLGRSLLRSDTL